MRGDNYLKPEIRDNTINESDIFENIRNKKHLDTRADKMLKTREVKK